MWILAWMGYTSYCTAIDMKILGIETSCDETAVALIEAEGDFGPDFSYAVLGNGLISQASMHAQYGGVFPNLAKREHAKNLVPILESTLRKAGALREAKNTMIYHNEIKDLLAREAELFDRLKTFVETHAKPEIDVIAVTHGPGLEPALWVGINFAKALAKLWDLPIVGVNHMEGHILMSMVNNPDTSKNMKYRDGAMREFEYPILALLISGGHTELILSKEFGQYTVLGETRDDAAGEAFDKVARLLGLPYPGGPEISRLAELARTQEVSPPGFKLTRPMMSGYDFSFSGLKTAVRRIVEARPAMSADEKAALAREFEETVADVLIEKTLRAVEEHGTQAIVVGGGVSANSFIRAQLGSRLQATGCQLLIPPPALATDNALMIALAGYFHAERGQFTDPSNLSAHGNLKLGK